MSLPCTSRCVFIAIAASMLSVAEAADAPPTYTCADLTKRLTDLELLAVLPPVGEKTALASSYDRASKYDATQDKYINWDANDDGRGFIREENGQQVLAEIQGPGCIWRTWSATPKEGHVKIYLDGAATPAVDLPFLSYFNQPGHSIAPFNRGNLAYSVVGPGYDNYTPIPFQKSCKIVGDKDWGLYFHFNYTQFPAGTVVPTFSMNLSKEDLAALDKANETLGRRGENPSGKREGETTEKKTEMIAEKASDIIFNTPDSGAITAIKIKVKDMPKDIEKQRTLLGQMTISMYWDGNKQPAVWSLLGDFFGAAAGAVPFQTLPTGLDADGTFYCYWYMPYEKGAKIVIGHDNPGPVTISYEITHAPLDRPASELGRFHAKWHRDEFLPTRKDRWPDWTLVTTQGRGRFVGTQLHVWSPLGGWWGEGDEKFYIDGEKFPSTFGTGTEDYFGYAWGSGKRFVEAFHSQPFTQDMHGHVDMNRWHISDSVPFQTSFEGDIEKYFYNERPANYAAVAYWYLAADGADPYTTAALATDRVGWWKIPPHYFVKDVIEGENMKVLDDSGVGTFIDELWGWKLNTWSNDHQIDWNPKVVGQRLRLQFNAPKAGKFHLIAHFTCSWEFGMFQMSLDGKPLGAPVDLFHPVHDWNALPECDLGVVDLTAGAHVLGAEFIGKNADSRGTRFGLDYIKLVPAN